MVVVIPARDEASVDAVLDSLARCDPPPFPTEILVVVNDSQRDPPRVAARSAACLASLERRAARETGPLRLRVADRRALPAREAGVGLARRLGMDEAVSRLDAAGCADGIIVCLDADCTVTRGYLSAIARAFERDPAPVAATVHFEHPLGQCAGRGAALAIARYELYLRYYRHGLDWARYPHAYYTVGSCLAVRRTVYERQGGMNRRKAAEDFYFMRKLAPVGPIAELVDATVHPSPRVSRRAPFGTGRAVAGQLTGGAGGYLVPGVECFAELADVIGDFDTLGAGPVDAWLARRSPTVAGFFCTRKIERAVADARSNTASPAALRKRLRRWFDAFVVMKLVRELGRHSTPVPIECAAAQLLEIGRSPAEGGDAFALLAHYRALDRAQRRLIRAGVASVSVQKRGFNGA